MPELPEVETIKNELLPHILGRRINSITLFWEGIVRQLSIEEFRSRIIGRKLTGLARRGKYLIFDLSSGEVFIIHLRMTGSLLVNQDSSGPPRHTRAIIHLDGDTDIFFRDPRKFGVADKLMVRKITKDHIEQIRALGLPCELSVSRMAIRVFYPNQR